jgi:hypothetical protein
MTSFSGAANGAVSKVQNTDGTITVSPSSGIGVVTVSVTKTYPIIVGTPTLQKAETQAADASVFTYTPPAAVHTYRLSFTANVTSATSGVISFTLTWKSADGAQQTNVALLFFQNQVATPATTFTTSAAGYYTGDQTFDVDNSGGAITLKWVGGGTTVATVSAVLELLQ